MNEDQQNSTSENSTSENSTSEKSTSEKSEWQQRELGALWKNEGRNQKYLSGYIKLPGADGEENRMKVVVFSNKNRNNDRAPHFRVYRSKELSPSAESSDSGSSSSFGEDSDLI